VHLIADALGLPLAFEITEGQRHDIVPAKELVARVLSRCLLADKAYDARDFRVSLEAQGCEQVIPSNRSRSERRPYDKEKYKARSEIEISHSSCTSCHRAFNVHDDDRPRGLENAA